MNRARSVPAHMIGWREPLPTTSTWTTTEGGFAIFGVDCLVWLSTRPPYCDRGEYLAHLETGYELAHDLDESDLWPRYYFDLERAKLEVEAWLKKRGQWMVGP